MTRGVPSAGRALACVVCAFVGSAGLARADTILLKNGSRIVGRVERIEPGLICSACSGRGDVACSVCSGRGTVRAQACTACRATGRSTCTPCGGRGLGEPCYIIRMPGGVLTSIPQSQVASVERSEVAPEDLLPPRESYLARAAKVGDDAEDELELAQWAYGKGLYAEAFRHARHAGQALPQVSAEANRISAAAQLRLEAQASKVFSEAFALVRSFKLAEAADALDAALKNHADNPLVADSERERSFLAESAKDIVDEFGSSLRHIASAVARKARTVCGSCKGAGSTTCAVCKGASEGVCPRCRGSGQSWCPDCNGTNWRLCITCGGAGRVTTSALGTASPCPECRGRGVVGCRRCKNGKLPCRACGGNGKIAGACTACAGKGRITCDVCLGTGCRHVEKLLWGPVNAFVRDEQQADVAGIPAWQGIRRGCIVTVLREVDVYGGSYASHLAAVAGEQYEVLLACVDNRDGRDQVAFAPDRQGLRLVTADARQIESVVPTLDAVAAAHGPYEQMFGLLKPTAILPGVLRNCVAVFPATTDLTNVAAVFWGSEDPWRLRRFSMTAEELAEVLRTLR